MIENQRRYQPETRPENGAHGQKTWDDPCQASPHQCVILATGDSEETLQTPLQQTTAAAAAKDFRHDLVIWWSTGGAWRGWCRIPISWRGREAAALFRSHRPDPEAADAVAAALPQLEADTENDLGLFDTDVLIED